MDNIRLILFFTLAALLFMLWQAWQEDYGVKTKSPETVTQTQSEGLPTSTSPSAEVPAVQVTAPQQSEGEPAVPQVSAAPTGGILRVRTDLLDLELSTHGGTVTSVHLLDYSVAPETPEQKFRLMKPQPPNMFIAQSGLIGAKPEDAPTHEAVFSSAQTEYQLAADKDELQVDLIWSNAGVEVIKRYTFRRGSYVVGLEQIISNKSGQPWAGREYLQLQRTELLDTDKSQFIYTFTGGAYYSPEEKYEKVSFEDIAAKKLDRDVTGGWVAMLQHYFVSAWIPPVESAQHFYTNQLSGSRYVIGTFSPSVNLDDDTSHSFNSRLYIGPKLQDSLAVVAPGLELTVDYGWLTVLAQPIFWLLAKLYNLVGNWGWAIILLTILIKLAFYKLSETSYKSMANMRRMTPRMQALKDRYGDDKQRMQQAMMEMYKKEKVNPLGGCLPILVQIPVFIALYWVLLESVELRQAPFVLWINNLSAKDPYYVLPLIMGVSMFVQQKLNPTPPDPMQAKIMMSLPFVFTVFFAFFPAGLVLYWVVNNLLSIAQQWHITRSIEKAAN